MDGGSVTTAAGTRFYISDDQVDGTLDGFRSIDNWVEVVQVESISEFGVESEDILRMAIGQARGDHIKGVRSPVGLNVIVGHDPFDDGQDEFDIAEGLTVQLAFRIVIPISGEVNNIIYFQALVRSNKLAVGTASDVVRRNYACTLNSDVLTVIDVTSIIFADFQGAGRLTASLRMRIGVSGAYAGAGGLTASITLRQRVSASFAGVGSLAADITVIPFAVGNVWTVTASLQGAGSLGASLNQRMRVAATFAGAGSLAANITVPTTIQTVSASFAGAGNLSIRINISGKVSATFQGAGRLVANITIGGVAQTAFQPNAFQNNAFQIIPEGGFQLNAFQNDAFQI